MCYEEQQTAHLTSAEASWTRRKTEGLEDLHRRRCQLLRPVSRAQKQRRVHAGQKHLGSHRPEACESVCLSLSCACSRQAGQQAG